MKEIHDKLAVWAALYKQCALLKTRLDGSEAPQDTTALQTEYRMLKARTEAAFKDASEAIQRTEHGHLHGSQRRAAALPAQSTPSMEPSLFA